MGNICVFCGKKLGLLDRYSFEVFKTKQTACKECLERLSALSGPELEAEKERLLASPGCGPAQQRPAPPLFRLREHDGVRSNGAHPGPGRRRGLDGHGHAQL